MRSAYSIVRVNAALAGKDSDSCEGGEGWAEFRRETVIASCDGPAGNLTFQASTAGVYDAVIVNPTGESACVTVRITVPALSTNTDKCFGNNASRSGSAASLRKLAPFQSRTSNQDWCAPKIYLTNGPDVEHTHAEPRTTPHQREGAISFSAGPEPCSARL